MPDTARANNVVVACPHCHTLVRVPADRLGDNPACARCKSAVVTGQPVKLDTAAFQTHTGRGELPVLVDFWAEWCGPCRAIAPTIDELATEYDGKVRVGKLNVDENQQTTINFGVRGIPAVMLFKGGKMVDQVIGSADKREFKRMIDKHLA